MEFAAAFDEGQEEGKVLQREATKRGGRQGNRTLPRGPEQLQMNMTSRYTK